MNQILKKLSNDIGDLEYMMYQEIPTSENGALNNLKGTDFINYYLLIKERLEEEFALLDEKKTPRITYIMYVNDYPVGEIMIRPILNAYWKEYSGNIGYKIRPSERNKGYGKIMLKLALEECRKLKMSEVYLQCMKYNIYSSKVILANNGKLIKEDVNTFYYKIKL